MFLPVLLTGCSQSVKGETAQVVVKEENKPPEKEVQPEEKQKKENYQKCMTGIMQGFQ